MVIWSWLDIPVALSVTVTVRVWIPALKFNGTDHSSPWIVADIPLSLTSGTPTEATNPDAVAVEQDHGFVGDLIMTAGPIAFTYAGSVSIPGSDVNALVTIVLTVSKYKSVLLFAVIWTIK